MLSFGKTWKSKSIEQLKQGAKLEDYKLEETIGSGTYGKVKLATHLQTNEKVAIKIINKKRLINKGDNERISNEIKILTTLDHPNILKAFEVFEDETNYYIVMERPTKGDLFNYICSKGRLSMDEASFIYYQIVNAIQYLHKNKIVHRDMKPENIMLTNDMIVKIGDFGLSKFFKSTEIKLQTNCGSPCYSAPEVLRGNKYKPLPVDIWGIGIILYCMICGELPFEDENEVMLVRKVTLCKYTCPLFVNQIFKSLFRRILCSDPNERLTIDKIKMNCVYNMGRANFYKYFKIYGEDGNLIPQVKDFIKVKALKSLEVAYAMEISKDSENMTGYKIFFNKYMHEIPWSQYYIPKIINEGVQHFTEEQLKKFRKNKKFRNRSFDKKNCDKIKKKDKILNNEKINNNDNNNNKDVLFIPEHETINDAIFQEEKNYKKIKISPKNIEGIRKLGVFSHSFDNNFDYKLYNEKEDIEHFEQTTNIKQNK